MSQAIPVVTLSGEIQWARPHHKTWVDATQFESEDDVGQEGVPVFDPVDGGEHHTHADAVVVATKVDDSNGLPHDRVRRLSLFSGVDPVRPTVPELDGSRHRDSNFSER